MTEAEDSIGLYLKEVRSCESLDEQERYELASRVKKTGDAAARAKMISANLPLVILRAKIFSRRYPSIGLGDFIGAGNIALIKAIDGFDPDQTCVVKETGQVERVKFSTYAARTIDGYMLILIKNSHPVHIPRNCQDKIGKVRKYVNAFAAQHNREPSTEEIKKQFKLNQNKSEHIEAQRQLQVCSLYDLPAMWPDKHGHVYNLNKKYWEDTNAVSPLTLIEVKEELARLQNIQDQIADFVKTEATPPQVLMLTKYFSVLQVVDPQIQQSFTKLNKNKKRVFCHNGLYYNGWRLISKFTQRFGLTRKTLLSLAEIIEEGKIFLADFYRR